MGLFTTRPQAGPVVNYYNVTNQRTILIVGLGNIGDDYKLTRHNIGFDCIEKFVDKAEIGPWQEKKDLKCTLATGKVGSIRVIAVKPTTYMNFSGQAVQAVASFYKVKLTDIFVIHDELDVDFGQIRLRIGGSAAGHNGIKSVSQLIGGEDYGRIRVGVGPKLPEQIDSADFVMQRFTADQLAKIPALTNEVNSILNELIFGGELPHDTRSFI